MKKLEEKLDGLVSLLKSTHEIGSTDEGSSTGSIPGVSLLGQGSRGSTLPLRDANLFTAPQNVSPQPIQHRIAATFTSAPADPYRRTYHGPEWPFPSESLITAQEAETVLGKFRDEICSFFPFISIPQSTSAAQLRQEKPFTYLAIVAVSDVGLSQRMDLSKIIIKQVAERVFVEGERNLDLLFGILTFAAWFVLQSCFTPILYYRSFLCYWKC